ncbi:hypothetical protein Hypma_012497 [Hypsizygus marmoreus]|uniref:CxC1-like cysteine cluster associated with KDZ transposases domain-containing protein n=1 Tax=Hypsizygus marmoreus TaxID=39966 RepID=A0A369JM01_HYPMA|nr:hypothetical protein Hypma_012497 [Hypsizygus marmoreus]
MLRKKRSTTSTQNLAAPVLIGPASEARARQPYGLSDLKLIPRVDLQEPGGAFVEAKENVISRTIAADDDMHEPMVFDMPTTVSGVSTSYSGKKEKQWKRWADEVIPSLLAPYLTILRESASLRDVEQQLDGCQCGARKIDVICVYFERLVMHRVCSCAAPLHLLRLGVFPCSPVCPTLAVDMKMLEYVEELFVHSAPNITAWCDTLEAFLGNRNYKVKTKDGLRRRFGNALHWYSNLVNQKNALVRTKVNEAREMLNDGEFEDNGDSLPPPSSSPPSTGSVDLGFDSSESDGEDMADRSDHERYKARVEDEDEDGNGNGNGQDDESKQNEFRNRPSEYLRRRCPLCFGGQNWHDPDSMADVIVCLDACFTQKRRNPARGSGRGPANVHTDSVFLSDAQVAAMKSEVEALRPAHVPKKSAEETDGFEPAMKVPTSALDGCNESFLAADEKRMKASTRFFSDTGLMALLCCHDRVLWLSNMTTAGERQYYALALIERLFENIPEAMTVGLLYDIGCQLHRSCEKWNFLEKYRDRISFGISVFHAYGHQWACQVIYHPRKCKGFGLSDGEGCERFWSFIKPLIPSLRVSGYYRRLYSIDSQVQFLDAKSLLTLGNWIKRKWMTCQKRKSDALEILNTIDIALDVLRAEWEAQVEAQTRPLPKQSKTLGSKAVKEVLALVATKASFTVELDKLYKMLIGEMPAEMEVEDILAARKALIERSDEIAKVISQKKEILGVNGRANLKTLEKNKFLQARMNALALKQHIRAWLRDRKFELERLERAYRHSQSSANKLHDHVTSQVKRHEPGIMQLCKKYNDLCSEMEQRKQRREAPPGAVIPPRIEKEGLFKLDVDDDIWQDIGLYDNEDGDSDQSVPNWLGDENTRWGIRALLELDRCKEEETRLRRERCAMQEWIHEEWHAILKAIVNARDDIDLIYELEIQKQHLIKLCAVWLPNVQNVPCAYEVSCDWGPTEEAVEMAQILDSLPQMDTMNTFDDDEDDNDDDEEDFVYDEDEHEDLWNALELSELADSYRTSQKEEDSLSDLYKAPEKWTAKQPSRSRSPKKKSRTLDVVFAGNEDTTEGRIASSSKGKERSSSPIKGARTGYHESISPSKRYRSLDSE